MKTLIDNDGNALPTPPEQSDVAHLIYLLEYCRRRKFVVGPVVQVGDVVLQVRDPSVEKEENQRPPEGDIWKEHGYEE